MVLKLYQLPSFLLTTHFSFEQLISRCAISSLMSSTQSTSNSIDGATLFKSYSVLEIPPEIISAGLVKPFKNMHVLLCLSEREMCVTGRRSNLRPYKVNTYILYTLRLSNVCLYERLYFRNYKCYIL